MRELIDCHIHTAACGHASGTVAQAVGAAVFGGLTGIVLTEHLPLPDDLNHGGSFAPTSEAFDSYAQEVAASAKRVKGVDVILGAEADWMPERPAAMDAQMSSAKDAGVQVLLGSVHTLDGWAFDSPDHLAGWDERGVDAVWSDYFAAWCEAARSGRYDVMAHPDLPKKFGHRPSFSLSDLYEDAALAAADGGVLIEVSTGGLRKPVAEMYPAQAMLERFHEAGVPVTVGSDAHSPSEVGYRIGEAYDAIAAAGYHHVAFPRGGGDMNWIVLG